MLTISPHIHLAAPSPRIFPLGSIHVVDDELLNPDFFVFIWFFLGCKIVHIFPVLLFPPHFLVR